MSRLERLREYARPTRRENWRGAGRDQGNIDRWSERASENSEIAPRASDKPMDLPSTTNRQLGLRSTKSAPRTDAATDARMVDARTAAKDDTNFVGDSSYMRGVRRNA
ncbi:MAG: hypothetical protein WBF73_33020 [Bradyrhizobium sp.]